MESDVALLQGGNNGKSSVSSDVFLYVEYVVSLKG